MRKLKIDQNINLDSFIFTVCGATAEYLQNISAGVVLQLAAAVVVILLHHSLKIRTNLTLFRSARIFQALLYTNYQLFEIEFVQF